MEYKDLFSYIQHLGTDPSRLIFEDELTGICNRRFLFKYLRHSIEWDSLDIRPVSLIMMDLDRFKQVNDTYGHSAGDQVIAWAGRLLKEVAGDTSIAVRYAGDEFMILMPDADKAAALKVGEQIIERFSLNAAKMQLPEKAVEIYITLSVGVASAPEDARTGEELIHQADTALYGAKKTGRNRLVAAGEVAAEKVFPKIALHRLEEAIAGRQSQFTKISAAFSKFAQNQGRLVIIEGASGMGKSYFLKVLRRHLAKARITQIAADGIPQEGFSPYYMTSSILAQLLNRQPDKGAGIMDELTPREVNYLSNLLPLLGEPENLSLKQDEKTQREQIFATIIHFISKLLDSQPLILFIDDLHFCDAATLLVLRRLLRLGEIPLFVCGTSIMIRPDQARTQDLPLEKFFNTYEQELGIEKITLTPLSASNIADHFKQIFPQVILPENFASELSELTQGNPLFISEIQRKLVLDGKITLTGQGWVIEPLKDEYLPKSLDEIVSQKLASLDEESRQLLDQVSAFGESAPLSALAGSSKNGETNALDIIDKAASQGLISSGYTRNDEMIRFKGKQILDITYGAIDSARKKQLHERVANYQEILYKQRLLPSAATVAYHFQRTANQEKTRFYREHQLDHDRKIFNASEAASYTGERIEDTIPEVEPLDPASLSLIPAVLRALLTAVRNIKLFPPGSKSILLSTQKLRETVNGILAENDRLSIMIVKNDLVVNGEPADITKHHSFAKVLIRFFNKVELRGIVFSRGVRDKEFDAMLQGLGQVSKKLIDRQFWQRFSAEQRLLNIDLKQIRYTAAAQKNSNLQDYEIAKDSSRTTAVPDSAGLLDGDPELDQQDFNHIPQVLRFLISASSSFKLYPTDSVIISGTIKSCHQALKTFLARRPALTLARVGNSLLINGQKVDTAEFRAVTDGFLKLMQSLKLKSLSFLETVSVLELKTFIQAMAIGHGESFDSQYWQRVAKKHHLTGILFDQRVYGTLENYTGPGTQAPEAAAAQRQNDDIVPAEANAAGSPDSQHVADCPAVPEETLRQEEAVPFTVEQLESMGAQMIDLLLKGEEKQVRAMIDRIFRDFEDQTPEVRSRIIQFCCGLLENMICSSQPRWVQLLIDPLLLEQKTEELPEIRDEMIGLLFRTAASFIQFGEYQHASRIFLNLRNHQKQLQENSDGQEQVSDTNFPNEIELEIRMLLMEDFKSRQTSRIQRAARLLSSLGPASMPMLVEVIKEEKNLGVRQIACRLMRQFGLKGGELLKRELALGNLPVERVRILEVIDSVTRELEAEMALSLDDENPVVRRAALRLAERLSDSHSVSLLMEYSIHENPSIAKAAIHTLGQLRNPAATEALINLLKNIKETDRLIVCCRALGKQADPAAIQPLYSILARKGFFSVLKKKSSSLRASAAYALAQIPDTQAADLLASHLDDRDRGIRRIARAGAKQSEAAVP